MKSKEEFLQIAELRTSRKKTKREERKRKKRWRERKDKLNLKNKGEGKKILF
jgi:hypothetical protein